MLFSRLNWTTGQTHHWCGGVHDDDGNPHIRIDVRIGVIYWKKILKISFRKDDLFKVQQEPFNLALLTFGNWVQGFEW